MWITNPITNSWWKSSAKQESKYQTLPIKIVHIEYFMTTIFWEFSVPYNYIKLPCCRMTWHEYNYHGLLILYFDCVNTKYFISTWVVNKEFLFIGLLSNITKNNSIILRLTKYLQFWKYQSDFYLYFYKRYTFLTWAHYRSSSVNR